MDKYSFLTNYLNGHLPDAYKYFGAHKMTIDGKEGYLFRVYAPMAKKINLVGDFNFFDKTSLELKKVDYRGLFELFVPGAKRSQKYKYLILGADNVLREKQDPFAFSNEMRVDTCSILEDLNAFSIHDEEFIKNRTRNFDKPVSIYELHMGTFKVKEDGSPYTYAQLADVLIPYLKDMAYTHVELLPITSYPNDASWGYQVSGYYAVDGRWGTIDDFAMFVEKLHKANIGIILDFVPVHFATDSFGLERFDGTCMYEYDNENEYSSWGSKNFDLGKDPVRSFLISSLFYFVDTFHIDGFRFDAVSNIIYWDGNKQRGINAHGYVCDVTDEKAVTELVKKIESEVGVIDILVNNAGIIKRIPMTEMSEADFRKVVDVDLVAPFICAKAVIPSMIKKGHGKIINICSMMSELGRETVSAYAAAKGGLKMLTRNICAEYGEYNIQCNGIGPGYIATPQTAPLREIQPDGSKHPFDQFIIAKTPAARWGDPEDLMGPAVFLASDASNFVNGHILYVDGGILAYIGKQPS